MLDFESVRFDIGAEMTCKEEDAEEAYKRLEEFVNDKVRIEEVSWKKIRKSKMK